MISIITARKIAFTLFGIGTLLFLGQMFGPHSPFLIGIGIFFIPIATIISGIAALLALIDLIKTDYLESFFSLCLLLANIPIAILYFYLLIDQGGL